jgi:hypothetical protein
MRAYVAERYRIQVGLNLGDLNAILNALLDAGAGDRRSDLRPLAVRIGRARDRRLRAVERAGG